MRRRDDSKCFINPSHPPPNHCAQGFPRTGDLSPAVAVPDLPLSSSFVLSQLSPLLASHPLSRIYARGTSQADIADNTRIPLAALLITVACGVLIGV